MTSHTRDTEIIGRRGSDGIMRFQFNLRRALQWVTLLGGIIGLTGWGITTLGEQVVTPPALKQVTDTVRTLAENQQTFTVTQTHQNARLTTLEERLSQMQVVLEIVAVQACRDLRSDPYAYRKANCAEYLETK
jgi:hypothetical protein